MCTVIVVVLFIAGLAVGFFILLSQPYPTITTKQGVVPGDTVPLYYASKSDIPGGGSRFWYESLTISLQNADVVPPNTSVLVFSVKGISTSGMQACSPLAGNTRTVANTVTLELNNTDSIFSKPFYFTVGATFSLDFSVDIASSGTTLLVYVLDNIGDYSCLRAQTCTPDNPKSFNVSTGTQGFITETFSIASYYFIVFSSPETIRLTYSYEATTQFYNYTNYSDNNIIQFCTVTRENVCTLKIVGNYDECAYAYTAFSDVDFVPLNVLANHRRLNVISMVFLAFFVASLTLLVICLLSVFVCHFYQRRVRKSGYNRLM